MPGLRSLLAAALLAAASGSIFEDCPHYWEPSRDSFLGRALANTGWRVFRHQDVVPCLMRPKMTAHEMLTVLENLYFGVAQIYSFTDIARDSAASVQSNKCGLEPHDVKVNIGSEIKRVYTELAKPAVDALGLSTGATPQQVYDALQSETEVPKLTFYLELHDVFRRLNDAHTGILFNTQIWAVLPLEFSMEQGKDGIEVYATTSAAMYNMAYKHCEETNVCKAPPAPRSISRHKLLQIGGEEPLAWLQRVADGLGSFHDAGQRLNALMTAEGRHGLEGHGVTGLMLCVGLHTTMPDEAAVRVKIATADQGEYEVDWLIMGPLGTIEAAFTTLSPAYGIIQEMFEKRRQLVQEYRGQADGQAHEVDPGLLPLGREARRPSFHAHAYRRALPQLPPEVLQAAADLAVEADAAAFAVRGPVQPLLPADISSGAAWVAWPEGTRDGRLEDQQALHRLQGRRLGPSEPSFDAVLEETATTTGFVRDCLKAGVSGPAAEKPTAIFAAGEFATVLKHRDMMVLKLSSMGASMDHFRLAVYAYRRMVAYAKKHGIKRLLIDLIGNGGGLVYLSDLLQSLLLKDTTPQTECNRYNKRMPEFWRLWVKSFGQGMQGAIERQLELLRQKSKAMGLDKFKEYVSYSLEYLSGIVQAHDRILEQPSTGSLVPSIEGWIKTVKDAGDPKEILELLEKVYSNRTFVPMDLFATHADSPPESGWYPFTGEEVLDPDTLKPFKDLQGILEPDLQRWGGVEANFTKRGIYFECKLAMATREHLYNLKAVPDKTAPWSLNVGLPNSLRLHAFEDIAILIDGLSGSAASAMASKLMASGYVTVFTYGGDGKIMDSSGFAGGNVLEYAAWWPKVATAAEMAMWMNEDSEWERHAIQAQRSFPVENFDVGPVRYPLPMPLQAVVCRFNFNMMYVREWSNQDSLPREFYRIPAHKHYNVWPRGLLKVCSKPQELHELYTSVQKEDWFNVRKNPQYLDHGWSKACVPTEEKRRCCGSRPDPGAGWQPPQGQSDEWPDYHFTYRTIDESDYTEDSDGHGPGGRGFLIAGEDLGSVGTGEGKHLGLGSISAILALLALLPVAACSALPTRQRSVAASGPVADGIAGTEMSSVAPA